MKICKNIRCQLVQLSHNYELKKQKIATKILFIILLLFIAISTYFALNYNFRRATFYRVFAFINLYEFYSIKHDVIQNDIKKAAK